MQQEVRGAPRVGTLQNCSMTLSALSSAIAWGEAQPVFLLPSQEAKLIQTGLFTKRSLTESEISKHFLLFLYP